MSPVRSLFSRLAMAVTTCPHLARNTRRLYSTELPAAWCRGSSGCRLAWHRVYRTVPSSRDRATGLSFGSKGCPGGRDITSNTLRSMRQGYMTFQVGLAPRDAKTNRPEGRPFDRCGQGLSPSFCRCISLFVPVCFEVWISTVRSSSTPVLKNVFSSQSM